MRRDLARELLLSLDLPPTVVDAHLDALEFMSRYKYDHYEMYAPGARFMLHLYVWLRQLRTVADRQAALDFVRTKLIFVSQREMQDLARFLYYNVITPEVLSYIISQDSLGPYDYPKAFQRLGFYLRRCIFIALSDGAKIDFFRRHHIDLSQEQILPFYRAGCEEYLSRLRDDTRDGDATFWAVFLIDDFTGSGTTLIREDTDPDSGQTQLEGSLIRVYQFQKDLLDAAKRVYLCHYISTEQAQQHVMKLASAVPVYKNKLKSFAALTLREAIRVCPRRRDDVVLQQLYDICDSYYTQAFETPQTARRGGIKFGYQNCGLPIVLYSNAPNNSIYPLWLEFPENADGHSFRSLFRRIDRHRSTR